MSITGTGSGAGGFGRGRVGQGPAKSAGVDSWDDDDEFVAGRPSSSSLNEQFRGGGGGALRLNVLDRPDSSTINVGPPPVGVVTGIVTGTSQASVPTPTLPVQQPQLTSSTIQSTPSSGPNDCEIIVLGVQKYAEKLEKHIRSLGLKVDLMFPTTQVPLISFIENLRSLGTAFAIVIRPENEERQSVTLHILKGVAKSEEHRNMPLDTCFKLLETKVKEFRQADFRQTPANVRSNIGRLLEHSYMTDMEYTSILKYVREQWERQRQIDGRDDYDPGTGICTKDELQYRISRILGAGSDSGGH